MTPSPAIHTYFLKRLIAGVFTLNLMVIGMIWVALQNSKSHHEEQAAITTRNISRVLDENLSGIFSKTDIALQVVCDEAEHQLKQGVIHEDMLNNFIIRQHSRLPELVSFRATNAFGDAVYGPRSKVTTTTSLAHRDYFKLLRDNPGNRLAISKPLIGGISGKWMVILARRINAPDGSFAGLVYAGLGLEYLTQSFLNLNVGANGSITLLDTDLSLVSRYPEAASTGSEIGKKHGSRQFHELIKEGKTTATYTANSSVDGMKRIFSFRRLANHPFYIITGLSTRDYLSGWRSEVFEMLLFELFFCVSTIIFAWRFHQEWDKNRIAQQAVYALNAELEERVTERTKSAENSSQTLQSILECMSDCAWALDSNQRFTYCSPNVEKLLGYTPDEMIGKSPYNFMDDEEEYRVRSALEETFLHKLRIKNLEHYSISKDGRKVLLVSNAVPFFDDAGNLEGYRGVDTDITEQKRAEEALRESNDRFYRIFNNAPTMMSISTLEEGRCLEANKRFSEISGFSREEIIGKTFVEAGLLTGAERNKIVSAIRSNNYVNDLDLTYYSKSGFQMIWKYSGQMIQLDGKQLLLSSSMDITEQRKLELQLLHSQKLDAVGQLAGGIAHDFNNKLTVILGCVELTHMDIDNPAKIREYLDEITTAAEHSQQMTMQLLGFSRQQAVMPIVLDANSCIAETRKSLSHLIGEHISFTFTPENNLWYIEIDPVQLDQIVMNMTINARDAMPNGGVFSIETHNVTFNQEQSKQRIGTLPGDYVCITFRDTGTGIDQNTLEHIFEPFFTTKEQGKGTGLGLATVHGIIHQNRGVIEVSSVPGKGTTFTVYFPRHHEHPQDNHTDHEAVQSGSGSILLVEDEKALRETSALLLQKIGYTVHTAESPGKALKIAADLTLGLDVVFTDMVMPEMNGIELVERIREVRPNIKSVFASGYSTEFPTGEQMAHHTVFIQKPYDLKKLSGILKNMIA